MAVPTRSSSPERPSRLRARVAIVAAAGLAVTGAATATATSASARFTPRSTLHIVASGTSFNVTGPRFIQSGLVKITMRAVGHEQTAGLASFLHGWTFADYRKARHFIDTNIQKHPRMALHRLNVAIKHSDFRGGLDIAAGHHGSMTVRLVPGTYTLFSDSQSPNSPFRFTVFGSNVYRSHPTPTARVWATSTNRFRGDAVLPARGTIRFTNRSDYSPHFPFMQHVAAGTTRAQVLKALSGPGAPNIIRPGLVGTDAVSPGQSQTLSYNLKPGTYAQLCFFPDPKTGMPHAFMGMVRIVQVK